MVLQSYAECGYIATLDFTKYFDLLRPEVTAAMLQKLGLDDRMVCLCKQMWLHPIRWLSWDGHTGSVPLRTHMAVPQGDPFGPLICAAWLSAGARFLDRTIPRAMNDGVLSIFMDDRTFTASTALGLKQKYDSWSTWSRFAGLIESGDKAQFAGKKAVNQRALAEHFDEDRLRRDILFLGVVSRGKPRSDHEKEQEGVAIACQRLRLLGALRLSTEVVGCYADMFGLSAVAYGWIGRLPTWKVMNKLWTAVKRAQNVAWMSNKWLRAIVLGGNPLGYPLRLHVV